MYWLVDSKKYFQNVRHVSYKICCAIAGDNMSQRAPRVALECVVHCVANHDTCGTFKLSVK